MKILKLGAAVSFMLLTHSVNAQVKDKIDKASKDPAKEKQQAKADVYIQKQAQPVVTSRILIQDSLPSNKQNTPAITGKKKIKIKHKKSSR